MVSKWQHDHESNQSLFDNGTHYVATCYTYRLSHVDIFPTTFHGSNSKENLYRSLCSSIFYDTRMGFQVIEFPKYIQEIIDRGAENI